MFRGGGGNPNFQYKKLFFENNGKNIKAQEGVLYIYNLAIRGAWVSSVHIFQQRNMLIKFCK